MKKNCLIIIFAALCTSASAQKYKSMFGKASTEWNTWALGPEHHHYPNPQPVIGSYHFNGKDSTLLNGKTYKQVEFLNEVILFREELDSGKVYYVPPCEGNEYIYMDYNVQVGDTFLFQTLHGQVEEKIVDSVYYTDQRKHIRCKLQFPIDYGKITFIEGIGCSYGLNSHYNNYCGYMTTDYSMNCVYQDGVLVYGSSCLPFTTSVKDDRKEIVSFSPNPVTSTMSILGIGDIRNISISDMQGRTLMIINNPGQNINLEMLPNGMYLSRISTDESVYTLKFIKR